MADKASEVIDPDTEAEILERMSQGKGIYNHERARKADIVSRMNRLGIPVPKSVNKMSADSLQNLIDEHRRQQLQINKAGGGYVKKYAHGGGVRKAKFMDS